MARPQQGTRGHSLGHGGPSTTTSQKGKWAELLWRPAPARSSSTLWTLALARAIRLRSPYWLAHRSLSQQKLTASCDVRATQSCGRCSRRDTAGFGWRPREGDQDCANAYWIQIDVEISSRRAAGSIELHNDQSTCTTTHTHTHTRQGQF